MVPTSSQSEAARQADAASQTAGTSPTANAGKSPPRVSTIGALHQLAAQESNATAYFRRGFRILVREIGASYAEMDLRLGANVLNEGYSSSQKPVQVVQSLVQAMVLESETEHTSEFRLYPTGPSGESIGIISSPLIDPLSGGCLGAIAAAIPGDDEHRVQQTLAQLQTLSGMYTAFSQTVGKSNDAPVEQILRALERASKHKSVAEFAFSLVNSLARKYNCRQVSFATVNDGIVQVVAVSGMDHWSKRAPGITALEQALGETLDFNAAIQYPPAHSHGDAGEQGTAATAPVMLHNRWRQIAGGAVLSMPVRCGEEVVALAGFVLDQDSVWSAEERERLATVLKPFAPVVAVLARQQKSWRSRLRDATTTCLARIKTFPVWVRCTGALALLAAFLFVAIGNMNYKVQVSCEVAPAASYQLSSSYSAPIRAAFVAVGDQVKKGQALLELETDELQLQLDGVLADTASARAAIDDALARRDSRDLAAARADFAELATRKSNLEKRLENAVLRAPVDGVVLRGDVDRRVGETVPEGEPLMEIAGNDGRLILLRIRECDALQLKAEQRGIFALEAQPFERTVCRVRRILPATEVHDGVNYVIAEADIGAHPDWVKVGMKGTASVDVGRRKVSWILFHDVWDWVRGRLWL